MWLNFVNLLMLHFYLWFWILLLCCICLWQYFAFKYFSLQLQFPTNNEEISQRCKSLDGLQIALRTQPHSFVSRFLESNGLQCLLNLLSGMDWDTAQSNIHTAALGCVKAIMNNSTGRAHVLAHSTGVNTISQSLGSENIKTKVEMQRLSLKPCQ